MLVKSKAKEELGRIDFSLKSTPKLKHFKTDGNGLTTLLDSDTQHEITYISIAQNSLKEDVCAIGSPIFFEAAKIHRKNVIDMLYERTQTCSNERCPYFGEEKKCLNLESQGINDNDLQEIMM